MSGLFESTDNDKRIYEEQIKAFIPDDIIDIHTHIWLKEQFLKDVPELERTVKWPSMVAEDNSAEDLIQTYLLMFPEKRVKPLVFSQVATNFDHPAGNNYVREKSKVYGFPKLMVTKPDMNIKDFESQIESGGFLGVKVYLTLSNPYIPLSEIRIYDFITPAQLEVLNKRGWILMLHIPRDQRLRDPVNLAQMVEIDRLYPDALVIIAHVGRAYCDEDTGDAFDILSKTKNLLFDISANTNENVFARLIKAVGPKRILFGSDLPILRMRTKRICEDGKYINLIKKGAYGDVSDDSHMREITGPEADALTFFMYEEILAFKRAAAACELTKEDIKDVFYNNAKRIINKAGGDI
jgi:predicted TIM-barrel fold metal-dependent hydrolase